MSAWFTLRTGTSSLFLVGPSAPRQTDEALINVQGSGVSINSQALPQHTDCVEQSPPHLPSSLHSSATPRQQVELQGKQAGLLRSKSVGDLQSLRVSVLLGTATTKATTKATATLEETQVPTTKTHREPAQTDTKWSPSDPLATFGATLTGCISAMSNAIGIWYAEQGQDKKAAELFQAGQLEGNPQATYNLALCSRRGKGIPINEARSIDLLRQAAQQDHPRALHDLAVCYAQGKGVPKDTITACQLLQEAAQRGCEESVLVLSTAYLEGSPALGITASPAKGFELLSNHRTLSSRIQHNLALCYKRGLGVEPNEAKARKLFRRAATVTA